MKKLTKVSLGVAAAVATVAAGAGVVSAWGPARATFTMEHPADYVTFNSITNNVIGDERYFVSASEYTGNGNNNHYVDGIQVEEGKEYVVRMYVHNNAGSNLGLVAENVRAYVILPTDTASEITVSGKINSTNANPKTVWDETTFKSKNGKKFSLAYVDGSAKYYNIDKNGKTRTFSLDGLNDGNDLFTSKGHLLGYDQMDGKIPGCNEYSGYLTFHVTPKFEKEEKPELEIQKDVKIRGTSTWSEQVNAKAGDTVRYRIHVKNIGNAVVNNLVVRDILPAGLTYVKGSTQLVNTAHKDGITLSDNLVGNGVNIGSYAAGAGAYIYFNATVDQAVGEKCEKSLLHNNAQTYATEVPTPKEDGADVLVDGKLCPEDPNFTINKMVQLNGSKDWAENITVKAGDKIRYRIQFKNTGDIELKNVAIRDILPAGIDYVKGSTIVDGKSVGDGIITAEGIKIGNVKKGAVVTVYFYATVNASLKDNCNDSTLTNVVKGKYNDDSKTEKSDTADVSVKGKTCGDTPVVPDLPKTGAASIITGIVGATSVATAAGYYIISRKKLN